MASYLHISTQQGKENPIVKGKEGLRGREQTVRVFKSHPQCLTLCESMDCSLPGSSVHGILQARTLEWVIITVSRSPSQPRY